VIPIRRLIRPASAHDASEQLREPGACAMGGGTDLLTQLQRGIAAPDLIVDLRGAGLDCLEHEDGELRIGAGVRLADLAADPLVRGRFSVLAEAAERVGSPQLREMGTVGGNLCQRVRCWYFRHPDLTCWLRGGSDCYAQLGDHRKHGLEPGDCISVAPSDLACALLALEAEITTNLRERMPVADLYRRPSGDHRSNLTLASGEFVTLVTIPRPPDASAYERLGERGEGSFALVGVAAARFGGRLTMAAIGVSNTPRALDPDDPLEGLPGLPMTGWKRTALAALAADAMERVSRGRAP
jgi:xanthine dehydrogenase YagS FAD-binding subunit